MSLRLPKPKREAKVKKRPSKARKTARGKLGRIADRLFSLIVRAQGACRWHSPAGIGAFICTGPIQCAHVFSRRYRSVRWDEDNAMPLCAGAHVRFTHDPIGWEEFGIAYMGAERYEDLKWRARQRWDGDLEGTVVRLKARAAVLGIQA